MNVNKSEMKKWTEMEYKTQYLKEVEYLKSQGIECSYKTTNKYGIEAYKYKKTSKLFECLNKYYLMNNR